MFYPHVQPSSRQQPVLEEPGRKTILLHERQHPTWFEQGKLMAVFDISHSLRRPNKIMEIQDCDIPFPLALVDTGDLDIRLVNEERGKPFCVVCLLAEERLHDQYPAWFQMTGETRYCLVQAAIGLEISDRAEE